MSIIGRKTVQIHEQDHFQRMCTSECVQMCTFVLLKQTKTLLVLNQEDKFSNHLFIRNLQIYSLAILFHEN